MSPTLRWHALTVLLAPVLAAGTLAAAVPPSHHAARAAAATILRGTWGPAEEVPGTGALNQGTNAGFGSAATVSVGCASAGDCGAGGYYLDGSDHQQAFVVSQTGGTWDTAEEVPGTPALNTGGNATINSVSCTSAGNCSAGGYYTDGSGHRQAFVISETNGTSPPGPVSRSICCGWARTAGRIPRNAEISPRRPRWRLCPGLSCRPRTRILARR